MYTLSDVVTPIDHIKETKIVDTVYAKDKRDTIPFNYSVGTLLYL